MVHQPGGPPGPGTVEGQREAVEQPGLVEQPGGGGQEQQEVFPLVIWVDPNHE